MSLNVVEGCHLFTSPVVIRLDLCAQCSLMDSHPITDSCRQAYPTLRPFFPISVHIKDIRQPARKTFESGTTHSALTMGRTRIGGLVPDQRRAVA